MSTARGSAGTCCWPFFSTARLNLQDLEQAHRACHGGGLHRLKVAKGHPVRLACQHIDDLLGVLLHRQGGGEEVIPDRLILLPGQQDADGPFDGTASAADLLVVPTAEPGDWKWMTKLRSGLSNPIPRALVAHTTFTVLMRRASSTPSRSSLAIDPS